jgi:hypothetical protein
VSYDTARQLDTAVVALRALVTGFPDLPAADVHIGMVMAPDVFEIGVRFAFHHSAEHFEQWRQALDIDPATVQLHPLTREGLHDLLGFARYAGSLVELIGYLDLPDLTATATPAA